MAFHLSECISEQQNSPLTLDVNSVALDFELRLYMSPRRMLGARE
jgi:hypothetical protein